MTGQAESDASRDGGGKGIGQIGPWPIFGQGIDVGLLLVVIAMVLFGLIMVYSASFIYAQERTGDGFAFIKKQVLVAVLGFIAMAGATRIPYRRWADWAVPSLATATGLLALVMVPGIGTRVGGAQRWIRMGFMNFQPGELAKFAIIVFVAWQLDRKQDRIRKFAAGVLSNFLIPLPALVLLLAQPDFGTTVMISITLFCMLFLAGVPRRYLGAALLLAAVVGAYLAFGTPYRRQRVITFMDPWQDPMGRGFQILQSFVGLHNGKFFGVGLGNGKEKLFYLPEAHNDFICAVIGEELGYIGIVAVALTYVYFIYRGLRVGWTCYQRYGDRFGLFLASGITLALGIQGFTNMAVVLGLVPTKGLTLPFISYGGSALMIDLFAIGVLLSIARGPQTEPGVATT